MENIYLSAFLEKFLEIVLPVLGVMLAGLVVQGIRWLEEKIKSERPDAYQVLSFLASAAVKSAEQAKLAGLIKDKRLYAFNFISDWLSRYGLEINVDLIYAEIEKAVYEEIIKGEG